MNKLTLSLFAGLFTLFILTSFMEAPPKSFYDLRITALSGKDSINFKDFAGKKILCVNTASECGYTPQYEDLQKLSEKYAGKLVIIGFPCNQFGEQEPGSADEISVFCKRRYGVTFPLTEKIEVKGEHQHIVYQWLTQKKYNGKEDFNVRWNFGKFLLDEKGRLMGYFPSQVKPFDDQLISLIEGKK